LFSHSHAGIAIAADHYQVFDDSNSAGAILRGQTSVLKEIHRRISHVYQLGDELSGVVDGMIEDLEGAEVQTMM
jgi:hypothetical protein